MARKNANGQSSISKFTKNGITYYKEILTIGRNEEGKLIRKTFSSKKRQEVAEKMNDYKNKMLKGELSTNENITLAEWYHTYLFEFRKNDLKPSTFERYYNIYINYILKIPIGSIKAY